MLGLNDKPDNLTSIAISLFDNPDSLLDHIQPASSYSKYGRSGIPFDIAKSPVLKSRRNITL